MRVSELIVVLAPIITISLSQAFVVPSSTVTARRKTSPLLLVPPGKEPFGLATAWSSRQRELLLVSRPLGEDADNNNMQPSTSSGILDKIVRTFSQSANTKRASPAAVRSEEDRKRVQLLTLLRVGIPSILAGFAAYLFFPAAALTLASSMHSPGVFSVLAQDSSQFVQNFLTVAGLLFSILVGQTCE
jgi:hypothetical protein